MSDPVTTIGFVGLGQMGRPIAANLMKSAAKLAVADRKEAVLTQFRQLGASASSNVAEVAPCDVLFLCLPNGASVKEALFGDQGVAKRMRPGQTVVDLSTIAFGDAVEIGDRLEGAGLDFLDAPVSGMEARAVEGALTVMCGGDDAVFARVRPLFELIGSNILHMGKVGAGQLTKLVNQLLFDINAAALAEVFPMAVKLGLDPAQMAQVVNNGTGRSYASEFFLPRILRGHFSDGYPMRNAYKDLVAGAEIAARECAPMPVLAAATATYQTALLRGYGALDKGGMIRVFEDLLGVECRSKKED